MSGNRRDRSRSPTRVGSVGRRRDNKSYDSKAGDTNTMTPNNMLNQQQQMMAMYQQGNMMMSGGMYPNMMMPNASGMSMMGSNMIPGSGIEIMPSTGMDMMTQPTMDMTAMSAVPVASTAPASAMDMGMMGGMMMDPSMMGMYTNMGGDMTMTSMPVEKKEIVLKYCKLTPPAPGTPDPPRRPKPLGCRTIFVGGLPEKVRESTVREIFESYGRIHTLRLSTKNFCHIRYDRENSVDAAMMLSGYHIKLTGKEFEDEDDESKVAAGWLHVDYALSRDDQNEYERRQRQALRAQENMMAQQKALAVRNNYKRSPSPMRIQPFSHGAIIQLAEKVKSEEHFANSLPTLIAWLERGECSKKNSTQFYSMIQATNSHIRRLFNEKVQAEEELQECKERIQNQIQTVIQQLEQVVKVFAAAAHQRVWDHFTKAQRKNIETWQKMAQEFTMLKEEFNEKFSNENEYDNNGLNANQNSNATQHQMVGSGNDELHKLALENDSLRFQLEAYKNEVDVIKADAQKEMEKFKAQFIARQALQGAFEKKPPLPQQNVEKPPPPPPLPDELDLKVHLKEKVEAGCGEAKLIGVMAAFLQVHPQGASLDYVVSYVRALFPHVTQATVHHVLQKHDEVFRCATTGVGANIEHRWSFVAFEAAKTK